MLTVKILRIEHELPKTELAFPVRGSANRKPAAGTVTHTGYTILNAAGTDYMREVIRLSNYTGETVAVTSAVDEETGNVLLYVVDPSTVGSIVCGLPQNRNNAILHLHSVFEHHPSLAVSQPASCPVAIGQDSTDTYCLVVTLKGVRPAARRSRTSGASTAAEPA